MPTSDTASSRDASSGSPVSSWITSAISVGALAGHPVDLLAHGGLVGQVGLEDQPEGAGVAGHVVVERRHRGRHPQLVVLGGRQGRPAVVDDRVAGLVEQREVEVQLAGEVLVEHRLGDPGALGDVVHRRGVVALGDEDLEGRLEQLGAAGACAACARRRARCVAGRRHVLLRLLARVTPCRCSGIAAYASVAYAARDRRQPVRMTDAWSAGRRREGTWERPVRCAGAPTDTHADEEHTVSCPRSSSPPPS